MHHDIIIIGGGASGIITSIIAKDRGLDVAIVEGNNRIGKKLLSTGNGRCNITNKNITLENYHSSNSNFFKPALTNFTSKDTLDFFYSLGIPIIELEDGKMYPMSLQSSSVLDILRLALDERNIPIYLNKKIKNVTKNKNLFNLKSYDNDNFSCNTLVLSCGGKSAPNTGSDGSGFQIAKSLDHKIIPTVPGLVQLKLNYSRLKALSGIKFEGCCKSYVNNSLLSTQYGEILFTDYGISGPPILQISSILSKYINNKNKLHIEVDFIPNINKKDLKTLLENHWGTFYYRSIYNSLIGIINKKLIPIILREAEIDNIHKPCIELSWQEKLNLLMLLKEWKFEVYDTNSFKNSQVTCGGVDTKYINPNTLESIVTPNLYFTGEILDVNGDCGGFNLQWAWSSGYVVGQSINSK